MVKKWNVFPKEKKGVAMCGLPVIGGNSLKRKVLNPWERSKAVVKGTFLKVSVTWSGKGDQR